MDRDLKTRIELPLNEQHKVRGPRPSKGADVARDLEDPWLEEARVSFRGLKEVSFRLRVA